MPTKCTTLTGVFFLSFALNNVIVGAQCICAVVLLFSFSSVVLCVGSWY